MKKLLAVMTCLAILSMAADACHAQPPAGRGPGGAGMGRGPFGPIGHPLLVLLDEDGDNALSTEEIEKAVAKLKKLDKNGDGKVALNELPRPGGPAGRGPGGPGAPGGGDRGAFAERILGLDKNGDGKISKDELPERMHAMFPRLDTNGDGTLDKAEIQAMSGRGGPGGRGTPPATAGGRGEGGFAQRFAGMDKDGDGKLSKSELPERMQAVFDRIDTNSDGVLDKNEMQAMAERLGGRNRERAGAGRPPRPDSR